MATAMSQEDINFLRLAGLLIRIAPRAVRQRFDYEFHPEQLQQFLSKNRRIINELKTKKRVITTAQYDILYPKGKVLRYFKSEDLFKTYSYIQLSSIFRSHDPSFGNELHNS